MSLKKTMQSLKSTVSASLLVVSLAGFSTNSFALEMPTLEKPSETLRAAADMVRAQAELTRANSEAVLNIARAELIQAQKLGELQKVREKTLLVNRLQIELRKTLVEERQLEAKAQKIEELIDISSGILSGRVNSITLQAFTQLAKTAFDPAKVFETMTQNVDVEVLDEITSKDESAKIDNVGQLIDFVRQKKLPVKSWGPVNVTIAQVFVQLVTGAQEKLETIKAEIDLVKANAPKGSQDSPSAPAPHA